MHLRLEAQVADGDHLVDQQRLGPSCATTPNARRSFMPSL